MANFTCDPTPFLPMGAHIEDGWMRPARSRVAIGGEPPRCHEEYGILSMNPPPHPAHTRATLNNIVQFLEEQYLVRVFLAFLSPLGLGLLDFSSSVMCQSMIDLSLIPYEGSMLRKVKHDEVGNLRSCQYIRECWIMFLCFPLDYQHEEFFNVAITPFDRRLHWHKGPNKSRSLVRCLVLHPDRVPRNVVISRGTSMGGVAIRGPPQHTFLEGTLLTSSLQRKT